MASRLSDGLAGFSFFDDEDKSGISSLLKKGINQSYINDYNTKMDLGFTDGQIADTGSGVYSLGDLSLTDKTGTSGTSLWGDFKSALGGDANFGKNLLGIGQFGLGLAQYLDMKPMLEKQGALLDQKIANNRVEMAATQDTRDRLAARAKV
jgi:hypothetical protein